MEVANTLAYYDKATIKAVKKFYSTGPRLLFFGENDNRSKQASLFWVVEKFEE